MDKFAKRLEARDVAGTSGNSSADYLVRTTYRSFPPVVPRVSTPRGYEGSEGLGRERERERERGRAAGRTIKIQSCSELFISTYLWPAPDFCGFFTSFFTGPISRTAVRPIIPPRMQFTRDSLRSVLCNTLQPDVNETIDSV